MRKKIIAQRSIFDQSIDQLKTLIRPERIFKQMDAVIDQIDGIVARIHKQLTDNVSNTRCRGLSAGCRCLISGLPIEGAAAKN